jgi:HJR/Mrr/RecB family endonuclease
MEFVITEVVKLRSKYSFKTFNRTRKRYGVKFNNKQGREFLVVAGVILLGLSINYFEYILPAGCLILGVYLYKRWSKQQAIRKSGIKEIDSMSGIDFEKRLEVMFKDLGYKVKRTPPSGDFGADLILENPKGKTVVQAKRYSRPIGVKAVQEVIGSMAFYNATNALVVTNSSFTSQAYKLAQCNAVELWDREKLIDNLSSLSHNNETGFVLDPAD